MRGIALGAGVAIITVFIPNRGKIDWKDLTDEEIKYFRTLFS